MAGFNFGLIAGVVYDADSGAPMPGSMVSMGAVYKFGVDQMTLYTLGETDPKEVKSIAFPPVYSDGYGIFGLVFQWDASDLPQVTDAAMSSRLEYTLTAWRKVGDMRVPSKQRGLLHLRPNTGGVSLPSSGWRWALKSAAAIEKAAKDLKTSAPRGLGTKLSTELYYLVDVVQLPAYLTAHH